MEIHRRALTGSEVGRGRPPGDEGREVQGEAVATAATVLAADWAIRVLKEGGTAFDAAVTAALIECVELPMKCGLAGDVVALIQRRGGHLEALVSVGPGARGHRPGNLEVLGPRSVGIPGAPAGYAELANIGRTSLATLAKPAIELAMSGPVWSAVAEQLTREAAGLLRQHNGPLRFLPNGRLPQAGERIPLPGLASVIECFVQKGKHLYAGELGRRLIERLGADCLLSESDLQVRTERWCQPVEIELQDARVWATPPPTHGPRLLEALRLARSGMDAREAARRARTGLDSGTSVVTAGDTSGNAVVLVHSNSFPEYGSGVVIEDLDLVLNNRPGRGFNITAHSDHLNAPAPGRMPETTLHAWVLEHNKQRYLGATPGGRNQLPWNLQAILCLMESESLTAAVAGPRWAFNKRGDIDIEANHREAVGGPDHIVPPLSLRSAQQIIAYALTGGPWRAAADPRMGGTARAIGPEQ